MEINKSFVFIEKKELNDSEMSVVAWGNRSDVVDRVGDKILDSAWKNLDDWMLNPSIVAFHDYTRPIGRAAWAKVVPGKGLRFKVIFSKTEVGKEFYQMYKEGTLNAFSVGFSGDYIETEDLSKEEAQKYITNGVMPNRVYTNCELYEISAVTIPANALSLVDREQKGLIKSKEIKDLVGYIKTRPEYIELVSSKEKSCENNCEDCKCDKVDKEKVDKDITISINISESDKEGCTGMGDMQGSMNEEPMDKKPEMDPEYPMESMMSEMKIEAGGKTYNKIPINDKDLFVEDSFKTIVISEDEGIEAVVGKLKSSPDDSAKIYAYLFDPKKMDSEKAKTCVEEHKDISDVDIFVKELEAEQKEDNITISVGDESFSVDTGTNRKFIELIDREEKEIDLDLIITDALDSHQKEIEEQKVEEKNTTKNIDIDKTIDFYRSFKTKSVNLTDKQKEAIKKQYGEDFDIAKVKTEPYGFEYKIFTKFLNCKIKDIFATDFFIPNSMMGNFLSAFKNVLKNYSVLDERNFTTNGHEVPLRHSVVQLNSKQSEEFLISGTRFYKSENNNFVIQFNLTWGGLSIDFYSQKSQSEFIKDLIKDAVVWVDENNLLKGEKFSISGEFLQKSSVGWDDVIFPSQKDEDTIKRNIERLNENANSRGMMFIGNPGNGKTLVGKTLLNKFNATFIWASAKDFDYRASSTLAIGFELARKLAPSVFFIEDIDGWLDGHTVDLLKTEMDGVRENKGVLTILTSNFPENIPEALIDRPGRFHHIVNFSLPNKENRMKLLKKFTNNVDKLILEKFVNLTEGFSGAHIKELVDFAKMIAEDENISLDEALIKSFQQMKEQRELIQDIKKDNGRKYKGLEFVESKELYLDIEKKEIPYIEVVKTKKQEVEIEQKDIEASINKAFQNILKDLPDPVEMFNERIMKAKGIIF